MTTTLGITEIVEAQAKKFLSHNEALHQIDFWLRGVKSRSTVAQPGSPAEGDAYILTDAATGASWGSVLLNEHDIMLFSNGLWIKIDPVRGPDIYVEDEDVYIFWNEADTSYVIAASVFGVNAQTGTTYTAALTDNNKLITMSNVADNVFTIPLHATVAFDIGTAFVVFEAGAGATSVVGAAGVVVTGSFIHFGYIIKVAVDEWKIISTEKGLNAQTGTTYTLVLSDAEKLIQMDNASANVLTIPTNATEAFEIGTEINVWEKGAGTTDIVGDTGVTVTGSFIHSGHIIKVDTDEWKIVSTEKGVNTQTGTTYTLVLSDAERLIRMDNAAANTLTIPLDASVPFEIGTQIRVWEMGAGVTTVAITATGTLVGTFTTYAIIEKVDTDTWVIA